MHISASILACDFLNIASEIDKVSISDSIHFDVMDGHFVNNISFGKDLCKRIHEYSKLPIYTHLMVSNANERVQDFIDAGSYAIAVHADGCKSVHSICENVKVQKRLFGLAIYSEYDFEQAVAFQNIADFFIFMTVDIGKSFQKLKEDRLYMLNSFYSKLAVPNRKKTIFADGGVNELTAHRCIENGANALISGGYIFKSEDSSTAIKNLKESCS